MTGDPTTGPAGDAPERAAPMVELFEPVDDHDRRLALTATGPLRDFNAAGLLTAADVHVGRGEQAGGVEVAQRPGGGERQAAVVVVDRLEELHHRRCSLRGVPGRSGGRVAGHRVSPPAGAAPSSRSDRARTRTTGGRQEKTPHGIPSTTGVSGPHMPRR